MGIYLGNILIPYYGLFIVIGMFVAGIIGIGLVKRNNLDVNDFFIIVGISSLACIIGAKVLYIIASWKYVDIFQIKSLEDFNVFISSGFVFYGGLIGVLLSFILMNKLTNLKIESYVTTCVPCIPIFHGFGRLGCHLVGCCYGKPINGTIGIVYYNSPIAPNGICLFPVQLLEAVIEFFIAGFLLFLIKKIKKNLISVYLFLYCITRFILENFRGDEVRGKVGSFSISQWISLVFILAILFSVIVKIIKRKTYISN